MKREITLSEKAYNAMISHILSGYPEEVCGVLVGDDGYAEDIRAAENEASREKRERSFSIDPRELYRIEKETKGRIAGFYHSHPDAEAVPSRRDISCMIPEVVYLIVSVSARGCGMAAGYVRVSAQSGLCEEIREAIRHSRIAIRVLKAGQALPTDGREQEGGYIPGGTA